MFISLFLNIHSVCFKVDEMFRDAPIKRGNFDYNEFTKILKYGKKEADDA